MPGRFNRRPPKQRDAVQRLDRILALAELLAPHDHPAVGKADPRHGVRDIQLHHLAHLLAQRCHINLPDDLVVQPVIERQISACFAGEDLQQLFWEKAAILRDAILTD
ncbi:hypothetical protein A7J32_08555 [Mycobacterium mungi]|uniref:DUF222 domain-containing protein n=1 Tax=Mycobacterium mungi TaxID=1844474 RepID=A0ABX2VJV7_9MYCO|nr:hypothetical protein A7J32_08555 [Mycobacterium mungi]